MSILNGMPVILLRGTLADLAQQYLEPDFFTKQSTREAHGKLFWKSFHEVFPDFDGDSVLVVTGIRTASNYEDMYYVYKQEDYIDN